MNIVVRKAYTVARVFLSERFHSTTHREHAVSALASRDGTVPDGPIQHSNDRPIRIDMHEVKSTVGSNWE